MREKNEMERLNQTHDAPVAPTLPASCRHAHLHRPQLLGVGAVLLLLSATQGGALAAPNRQARQAAHANGARTWHVGIGTDSLDHAIMVMGYLLGDLYIDVGDTVVWTSRSMQMHTVTFEQRGVEPPPYSPGVVPETRGPHYDGVSYTSSGPMTARPRSYYVDSTTPTYMLTFVKPGSFTYVDMLYHSLTGRIHVRPAGTPYPLTQAQVDAAAAQQVAASMAEGRALAARATHESNNHQVTLGMGNGHVSVNRFFPVHIVVHVGDIVTFTNRDPINTHTVTFDSAQESDPTVQTQSSPARFDGTPLASGLLGRAQQYGPNYATSYKVQFVKAGHFTVYCALNDDLGMRATVDVLR